jgi:hypothetical protein
LLSPIIISSPRKELQIPCARNAGSDIWFSHEILDQCSIPQAYFGGATYQAKAKDTIALDSPLTTWIGCVAAY